MSLHLLAFPAAFCKMSEVMFRLSEAISLRQGYRLDHTVGDLRLARIRVLSLGYPSL